MILPRFQFTPARGGRHWIGRQAIAWGVFQFTPARGGRPRVRDGRDRVARVSIHARAWRATPLRKRRDPAALFQFTPARGGRRQLQQSSRVVSRFNSRPRVAGDVYVFDYPFDRPVSIHARAWRATTSCRR